MKTKNNKLSTASRVLMLLATGLLIASIFLPIWQIDLDAPQYPEGLKLKIYSNKLAGDVEIINGLNHYIGMKTLHANDFTEFTVLPYIIAVFALGTLLVTITGSKKLLNVVLIAFILFGILAMVDFWRWEYDYGHKLDPNAAIQVPGMAYQPPLIGFKQLLNFGAFSVPDTGGWMFVGAGLLMVLVVATGWYKTKKNKT
jgi:copper chaperone NosL